MRGTAELHRRSSRTCRPWSNLQFTIWYEIGAPGPASKLPNRDQEGKDLRTLLPGLFPVCRTIAARLEQGARDRGEYVCCRFLLASLPLDGLSAEDRHILCLCRD